MKSIGADKKVKIIELMRPMISETGEVVTENNIGNAKFDVTVDVGPSSSSKRASTVRELTGMMSISDDPETKQVLQAMAMMNMEGDGISEVRDYFRSKLVRMGVVKPTDEEKAQMTIEMQGKKQDPNEIFLQAAAEEAMAKAAKARADTVKTVADAGLSRARTAETLAKTGVQEQNIAMTAMESTQKAIMGQEVQPIAK
jgi:hypothetical protein